MENGFQVMWTFLLYLEVVAILFQLVLLLKKKKIIRIKNYLWNFFLLLVIVHYILVIQLSFFDSPATIHQHAFVNFFNFFMLLVHTMKEFYEEEIAMLMATFGLVIQIFNIIVMINALVAGYYHTCIKNRKRKRSKLNTYERHIIRQLNFRMMVF